MPAYDYRCPACDRVFEVVRPINDRNEVACPSCQTVAKRLFSPVGVVFKGSGFHNTDYRPRPESGEPSGSRKDSPAEPASTGSCATCPAAPAPGAD